MQPLWRTVWQFLRKLKVELPHDQQSHSWTKLIQKGTYTPIFIVALFMIAKTWKQAKCSSVDE